MEQEQICKMKLKHYKQTDKVFRGGGLCKVALVESINKSMSIYGDRKAILTGWS